ncbi:PAS domain-containing sensor histidine kinase [Paraburkholderia humisilvae]|uniref:PAS domain-containing sensor histidine kinase n=1 Tax=Paraburkholderia humisilvae TaxID=627669 RepID=UPI001FE8320E|nr:PAS domain-containing protein [Paraburkholderia humisilvae]
MLGSAVFAADVLIRRHFTVAVLYVLVILFVAMTGSRRATLAAAWTCAALTVIAPALSHFSCVAGDAGVRSALSVIAIAVTTLIAVRHQTSNAHLIEQIHLLNLTHDAIVIYDMKDRIAFWSHGAEDLYGWPAHRALRQPIHELTQTRFPAASAEVREALLQVGRWDGEVERTRHDGKVVIIASRLALLRDERGKPRAVLATDNDITGRKHLQAELQRKQDEMSAMLEAIPGMIWASTHDGKVEPVNRRWDAFDIAHGNAAQNGRSLWRTLVHPHDLPRLENDWRSAVAGGSPFESTARLRRKDGLYRWMHLCAEPLRDTAGQIVRWYGINTDIEECKRAEEALERSEAFLAEGQRLSRTGSIAMKLPDGEMLWSQEAYRIFGYAANVVPSMDLILARTHPDDIALVRQSYRQVLAETPSIDIEHRLVMPDRSIKHVHYVAHLSARQSGRFEYVGALMDVTETKQTEEALTRSMTELAHVTRVTMLGELTASIAHEVSQPIAAIVTCGHAALRWLDRPQPDLAEAREAIDKAIRSAKRASDIVWRIRSMAQKRGPSHAVLDLNALVDESIELVLHELHDHQVELDIDYVSPPPQISGDRVQLQQVLINLIMNGTQAMASVTGRAKRMWVTTSMADAQHAHVIVKDSGTGISAEHAKRLFEAFFTTKSEGIGIGLSICRSIVEAHGGHIWAESPPEGGAVLQFTLPVYDGRQQ